MTVHQQIVIADDVRERTPLLAQAPRDSGFGVMTLRVQTHAELHEGLSRLKPDLLVIGDEGVIDLKAEDCGHRLQEIGMAVEPMSSNGRDQALRRSRFQ